MGDVIDFKKRENVVAEACCDWLDALLSGDTNKIDSHKKRMDDLGAEVSDPVPVDGLNIDFDLSKYTNGMLAKELEEYNEWRRGGEGDQPSPKFLGFVIEETIKRLRS